MQQSPEPEQNNDYGSNYKTSPYAAKEKSLQKALFATITQTPRRVEPPFGILELPRFETTSPKKNLIKVADSSHQDYDDEQWGVKNRVRVSYNSF